jgi:transketolase
MNESSHSQVSQASFANVTETPECWQEAPEGRRKSSVLATTRRDLPHAGNTNVAENLSARGAFEISPASKAAMVSLYASGPRVEIAIAAQKILEAEGTPTRVVSVPCFETFLRQDAAARRAAIGEAPVRVAVATGLEPGWGFFLGDAGSFVGMSHFGFSAPHDKPCEHFGIDAGAVAQAARKGLNRVR